MRRPRLKPLSAKRAQKIKDERAVRVDYLNRHPFCEAKRDGIMGGCFGPLNVHEVVPRGRGGDTGDQRIFKALCSEHNRGVSQVPEMMEWAAEHGYLYHSYNDFFERHGVE